MFEFTDKHGDVFNLRVYDDLAVLSDYNNGNEVTFLTEDLHRFIDMFSKAVELQRDW